MLLALDFNADVLTPIVTGAIQGALYGLLGLGLVLLYKGNRIFNFAQGEFGTVAALLTYAFVVGSKGLPKMPYFVAVLIGITGGTLMALLTERLVARPLFRQPKVTTVVATAGVALLAVAIELMFTGTNPLNARPAIRGNAYSRGTTLQVSKQQVLIVLVLAVLAVLSALFFSRTQTGLAILAVSQEPTATSLVGISVNRISALTWGMAGFLGAVAGVLLAPLTLFTPGFMTAVALIPAFTAAVFGGITSLPGAFLGGVVIGIIEQFGNKLPADKLPGGNRVFVFAALLLILLIKPSGLLGKEA